MYFDLPEEPLTIQKQAREFAQNNLKPGVIGHNEYPKFLTKQIKILGELGFTRMMVDRKFSTVLANQPEHR